MEKHIHNRTIKLIPIGNSKGIRLSRTILRKYGFSDSIVLEEKEEGILLHKKDDKKLSWEETYQAMVEEEEQWEDFDVTLLDGLEEEDIDSEKV